MIDTVKVRALLREVYADFQEVDIKQPNNQLEDFAFHVSECLNDMESLLSLLNSDPPVTAAKEALIRFLYHVVPHLTAAARLFLDEVPDSFGAFENGQKS